MHFSALVASPLTKVKLINQLNEREADLGVKETVSWHSEYKDSAWIFIGKFSNHKEKCFSVTHHNTDGSFADYCRRVSL